MINSPQCATDLPVYPSSWSLEDALFVIENRQRMSMKDLAEKIGKTKGSVSGFLFRNNVKADPGTTKELRRIGNMKVRALKSGKPIVIKRIKTVFKRGVRAAPQVMAEPAVGILGGVGVKMWQLEPHHCKWVVGEPKNMTCCGNSRHGGSPYCQDHHHISYTEPRRQGISHGD